MFNLSTLSGINLQTDNYFQYTSVDNVSIQTTLRIFIFSYGFVMIFLKEFPCA